MEFERGNKMPTQSLLSAKEDFRRARQQASMQQLAARISGRSMDLMDYEEIRRQLRAYNQTDRGLQEIPVDAIVGSVGRSKDFTRTFLPTGNTSIERWSRVKNYVDEIGMDPISVYKIGEVYFVLDGNHRVSIARQNKVDTIPAYVTEVQTSVPLSKDDDIEDAVCKARYTNFMQESGISALLPEADLSMSQCGYYSLLREHIAVHRYFMGLDQKREVPYDEAVRDWYFQVYLPIVDLARAYGLPESFPGYTDTDLYVMAALNRSEIEEDLGWQIDSVDAVNTLPSRKGRAAENPIQRVSEQIFRSIIPDSLQAGPDSGVWRRERLNKRNRDGLFADILVAGRGEAADYVTFEHALIIAEREGSRLIGLRVLDGHEEQSDEDVQALQQAFEARCLAEGVPFATMSDTGSIPLRIVERGSFTDLIALSLFRTGDLSTRLGVGSDFTYILDKSRRPVLVVPEGADSPMDHLLLAYDGSPKADEALYLAAYAASAWQTPLSAIVVGDTREARQAVAQAEAYLKTQNVPVAMLTAQGRPSQAILNAMDETGANLLLMGGYSTRPIFQMMIGSTLNAVLTQIRQPLIVCR